MTNDKILEARELYTWFSSPGGTVRAVDGVSFDLHKGETFALLGESGSGKTMTALSIMQLLPETGLARIDGDVYLGRHALFSMPERQMRKIRGCRIAMIFQDPMISLNPVMTVGRQIGESLRVHKRLRGRALQVRILELLEAVGLPDPECRIAEYPHQLSGGMKQRVMIAMALAGDPEILIADEPTTALDVTIQAQVLDLLKHLQKKLNMAILLITHDLGVITEMADRIGVMYAGQLIEQAGREAFFAAPGHPYTQKLFGSLPDIDKRGSALPAITGSVPDLIQTFDGCRFAERCPQALALCRRQVPDWFSVAPGRQVRCHLADPACSPETPATETASNKKNSVEMLQEVSSNLPSFSKGGTKKEKKFLLEVEDLNVHFPVRKGVFKRIAGHVRAVDGLSLALRAGRTLALVGESGCGKTTAGQSILQLIRPTSGSVAFDGDKLTGLKERELRKRRAAMQIIFQDPYSSMNPRMMIENIVEEGMLAFAIGKNSQSRKQRVAELLEHVGLPADAGRRYPHEFSGGQRQRICIARVLAVQPKLIVCDEPTSALDISVQAQILNLLKTLQEENALSYLFITHNLSVVAWLAHDVAVMYLGRIVERGTVREILETPQHPYTQALLSAAPMINRAGGREIIRLRGEQPSSMNPPPGCRFHSRCPKAMMLCRKVYPEETLLTDTHRINCHFVSL